jgi:hypothetical protein
MITKKAKAITSNNFVFISTAMKNRTYHRLWRDAAETFN